ncbi:single-stranded-DNA-specific exonuclease [Dokdonella fugitiva]|uniref:Single-stranded-DNA-specific exonuclease RecJ n=1 Tax=Dokdonella fugitiva TaxID=328517 RepID=A0A839ETU3_9GAMM|nr:single-stranded-DNA-specific exonuclease RecJ [Dokdonella fugitiva]MBA8886013.1 single-stranded-DNA-specific exonuclease [Dokdonella fugitiva]
MKPIVIRRRSAATRDDWPVDLHPLVARVYAARGVAAAEAGPQRLSDLLAPAALGGVAQACDLLADAIAHDWRICIVGDFDADGATGTAVAVRGLRLLGARDVCYRVPNRMVDGYGLGVGLVDALADIGPDLVVTVDNGIASHAGVAAARARGMRVIVTDHHLPGPTLPPADAIVNPNAIALAACPHASPPCADCASAGARASGLAGVGVMFYLLLALRARLFPGDAAARPDLASLLDLVALGTVADLVPLDANNRILVAAGLHRIRSGRASAGVAALYRAAGRDPQRAVAADLGYALGPRINAAGRLEDMSLGIECLLSDDADVAYGLAERLSAINAERRELQAAMVEQGEAMLARFVERYRDDALPCGIVLHEADWHPGVVGLVASKLKERLNRPVVAFACADGSGAELRGSARSIAGFHLRDALAEVDAAHPGLIGRFGGHAMAAGLSLPAANLATFAAEFDAVARRRLDAAQLERCLWSDGELAAHEFTADNARALRYAAPWGQAFPEPAFDNVFAVESWRAVGEKHLRMQLRPEQGGDTIEAILFDAADAMPPPSRVHALFQLDLNDWNGRERLQLLVRHLEPA